MRSASCWWVLLWTKAQQKSEISGLATGGLLYPLQITCSICIGRRAKSLPSSTLFENSDLLKGICFIFKFSKQKLQVSYLAQLYIGRE